MTAFYITVILWQCYGNFLHARPFKRQWLSDNYPLTFPWCILNVTSTLVHRLIMLHSYSMRYWTLTLP